MDPLQGTCPRMTCPGSVAVPKDEKAPVVTCSEDPDPRGLVVVKFSPVRVMSWSVALVSVPNAAVMPESAAFAHGSVMDRSPSLPPAEDAQADRAATRAMTGATRMMRRI